MRGWKGASKNKYTEIENRNENFFLIFNSSKIWHQINKLKYFVNQMGINRDTEGTGRHLFR